MAWEEAQSEKHEYIAGEVFAMAGARRQHVVVSGNKFAAYRSLEALKEYVIVDIAPRRVEFYRRTPENDWLMHEYLADGVCEFSSLGVAVPMAEIFENVSVEIV